ncbi:activating transcription factor 3 [Chelonus insularis]|uniref:activating transcription factor 3 n=1 Tax=Chelonus insularis TaxID=460826 RepID=UPI00158A01B9|nr:activating transcription factor 3 [Chelonus insularis]
MYNLNVNVNPSPTATGLLGVTNNEVTPRTPEIVNSLIAMTNPFEGFVNEKSRDRTDSTSSGGEPSPPSVQHTCSQLIKEGLKLTLQTKRRANNSSDESKKKTKKEDGSADDEEDEDSSNNNSSGRTGLTPEDEERRRRRRERNKIAATKCRLKKREKTVILVQESETLESQNHDLKSQIQELETQRRRLVDMLSVHTPTCIKQGNTNEAYQPYTGESLLLPYSDTYSSPSLNQPQDCISLDYPIKMENYDTGVQDFYRQDSAFVPTSDAGCTV